MESTKQYGAFGAAAVIGLASFALGDYALMGWMAAAVLVCVGVVLLSPRWGLFATASLGFACSAYLFQRKFDTSESAICNVSAKINCDVVNTSAASEIFGVPIALLGIGFFLGVAIATFQSPGPKNRLYQTTGLLSAVGVLYSIYLAFAAYQIGAFCVMCVTIYACTFLLVLASVSGAMAEGAPLGDALFAGLDQVVKSSALLTIVVTFLAVLLVGHNVYSSVDKRTQSERVRADMAQTVAPVAPGVGPKPAAVDSVAESLTEAYVIPRGPIELEGDEPVLGDPNAPYVVVEFACFGCGHCAAAAPDIKALVAEFPDVQVRFRSFPLSKECNEAAMRGGRPEVCRAAMAGQCANQQGKFWDYSAVLFANQHQLGDELFAGTANQLGLDFDKFSTCMSDPATLQEVTEDGIAGAKTRLMGTPALFLKGTHGDQWVEVCWGAKGVAALVDAHKRGVSLLPPRNAMCPLE